jgi:hypothetical protein
MELLHGQPIRRGPLLWLTVLWAALVLFVPGIDYSAALADGPSLDALQVTAETIVAISGGPILLKVTLKWHGDGTLVIGPLRPPGEPTGVLEIHPPEEWSHARKALRAGDVVFFGREFLEDALRMEPGEDIVWIVPLHVLFDAPPTKSGDVRFVWRIDVQEDIHGAGGTRHERHTVAAPTASLRLELAPPQ